MIRRIRPFAQIQTELLHALAWLASAGCSITDNERVVQYRGDLEELERTWQSDGGQALIAQRGQARLVNSLMEADAIADVVFAIRASQQADPTLISKIRDCLQGPPDRQGESAQTGSNHPRNLFFELRILARLLNAGLAATCGEKPDIRTEFDNRPVHIECKRLFSLKSVDNRVLDARRQLTRSLGRVDQAIGVIALDLTRFVSAAGGFMAYKNAAEASVWVETTKAWLRADAEPSISKALRRARNPRIVGVVAYFEGVVCNLTTKRWGTGYSLDYVPVHDDQRAVFNEFFDRVEHGAAAQDEG